MNKAREKRRIQACSRKQRFVAQRDACREAGFLTRREGVVVHTYLCPYATPGRPHWHVGRARQEHT